MYLRKACGRWSQGGRVNGGRVGETGLPAIGGTEAIPGSNARGRSPQSPREFATTLVGQIKYRPTLRGRPSPAGARARAGCSRHAGECRVCPTFACGNPSNCRPWTNYGVFSMYCRSLCMIKGVILRDRGGRLWSNYGVQIGCTELGVRSSVLALRHLTVKRRAALPQSTASGSGFPSPPANALAHSDSTGNLVSLPKTLCQTADWMTALLLL